MLSFMREQGSGPEPGQAGQAPQGGEAQDYLTVAANSKSVRKSTILVIVLIAIGLVGLWFMIRKSRPLAASAKPTEEESKIEIAISRLTGVSSEMSNRMDEVVTKFYEFSDVCQVEVGELAKNPFEVEIANQPEEDDNGSAEEEEALKAAQLHLKGLKQRAAELKLLSIMRQDGGNACMINDEILTQGEVVEGFTITHIGSDFVELTHPFEDGHVLDMDNFQTVLKLAQ